MSEANIPQRNGRAPKSEAAANIRARTPRSPKGEAGANRPSRNAGAPKGGAAATQPARKDAAPAPAPARRGLDPLLRLEVLLPTARVAALGIAGGIEGLLLASSPVLERYAALRLGPEGILVDLALLFAIGLAAIGCAAALAPWAQATFVALVVGAVSWSLAESSLHPFWIFSNKGVWRPHAPDAGVVVAHFAALSLVCAAAMLEAMQAYRRAAREQSFAAADLERDLRRLARNGALLLAAAVGVAAPLVLLLDGAADDLAGALPGRTAFTVLLGSAVLMLVGLGLLASPGKPTAVDAQAPRGPDA